MTVLALTVAANTLRELLKASERDYLIDDTVGAQIVLNVRPFTTVWRKRIPGGLEETSRIEVDTNLVLANGDCSISLEDPAVSSKALLRFIEIKAMLEKWKAGDLKEMPPSTFTPKNDDVEYVVGGRGNRRRRIRVDE